MGRFHVCMPVAEGDDYCCALCHRDMSWEMSPYAVQVPSSSWEVDASQFEGEDGRSSGCANRELPEGTRRH